LKQKIGSSDQEPAKPGVTKRKNELEGLMDEKEQIKKEYESQHDELHLEMRAAVKAQKEKKVEMNQLAVRLRELEQEERITEFKFRDVKRQMRHNHLKPISRAGSEMSRKSSIMSA